MTRRVAGRSPAWWAAAVATCGNVAIGAGAFWLSFTALSDLAGLAGVPEDQTWAWAVIVDGVIVISTVAVVALDGSGWRAIAYPWVLLALSAGVSVVANVVHAIVQAPGTVPAPLAGAIAAVPPLVLLATTHLTVVLIRHAVGPRPEARRRSIAAKTPESAPLPPPARDEPAEPALGSGSAAAPAPPAPTTTRPALPPPAPKRPPRAPGPSADSAGQAPAAGGRERAQELFEEGWSSRRIAAELGVHRSTVSRWVAPPAETDTVREPADIN